MRVLLRPQIDIALCPAQRLKVTSYVRHIGFAVDHRADHEGSVDDLAIAELLGEIIGAAKQCCSPRPALEERLHAAEQHALVKREIDLLFLEVGFEGLDSGVMAARLESNRDGDACEIGRRCDPRVGRHEDPGRSHRVGVGKQLRMAARSGDIHGPMASARDIGFAPFLDALESTAMA